MSTFTPHFLAKTLGMSQSFRGPGFQACRGGLGGVVSIEHPCHWGHAPPSTGHGALLPPREVWSSGPETPLGNQSWFFSLNVLRTSQILHHQKDKDLWQSQGTRALGGGGSPSSVCEPLVSRVCGLAWWPVDTCSRVNLKLDKRN